MSSPQLFIEKTLGVVILGATRRGTHQRGSLGHTLFGPFPRLVLVCINADFCDQGRIFPHFSSSTLFSFAPFQISVIFQAFAPFFAKFAEFFVDFQRRQQILQIFVKFQQIFSGILQKFNFNILQKMVPRLLCFREI